MFKKARWIIVFFLFLFGFFYFLSDIFLKKNSFSNCAFCNPKVLSYQTFYEDDLVMALYTHKPILPGHCLIIPKKHIERFEDLSDEEMINIFHVIQKVNRASQKTFATSSYLLLQKNGKESGQTVPHVHFHFVPKKAKDDSQLKFLYNMLKKVASAPISSSSMKEMVQKMKKAMEEN